MHPIRKSNDNKSFLIIIGIMLLFAAVFGYEEANENKRQLQFGGGFGSGFGNNNNNIGGFGNNDNNNNNGGFGSGFIGNNNNGGGFTIGGTFGNNNNNGAGGSDLVWRVRLHHPTEKKNHHLLRLVLDSVRALEADHRPPLRHRRTTETKVAGTLVLEFRIFHTLLHLRSWIIIIFQL